MAKQYTFRIVRTPIATHVPGLDVALVTRTEDVATFTASTPQVVKNHLAFRSDVKNQDIVGRWRYLVTLAQCGRGNAPRWWKQFAMDALNSRTVGQPD